jgi:hypothetical protein
VYRLTSEGARWVSKKSMKHDRPSDGTNITVQ